MILSRLRKFHHYLVFRDFLIREVISLHKAHLAKVIRTSLFFRQASKVSTVIKIPVKLRVLTFLANSIQVPVFFSHKNKEEAFSTKTTLSLESLQLQEPKVHSSKSSLLKKQTPQKHLLKLWVNRAQLSQIRLKFPIISKKKKDNQKQNKKYKNKWSKLSARNLMKKMLIQISKNKKEIKLARKKSLSLKNNSMISNRKKSDILIMLQQIRHKMNNQRNWRDLFKKRKDKLERLSMKLKNKEKVVQIRFKNWPSCKFMKVLASLKSKCLLRLLSKFRSFQKAC